MKYASVSSSLIRPKRQRHSILALGEPLARNRIYSLSLTFLLRHAYSSLCRLVSAVGVEVQMGSRYWY